MLEYLNSNMEHYLLQLSTHITLCLECLMICILVGVPLGFLCFKRKERSKYVVMIFQVLRIIPSLAVLLILIPVLGVGKIPAILAMVLLGICPVLMNTIDGFQNVEDSMLENGYAMGMNEKQVLIKVHLPLALPTIVSGIKIAAVELVSSATLAAKIGAGGLGEIIFTGLGLNRMDMLVLGGLSVMGLALLTTILFTGIEKVVCKGR